MSVKRIVGWSLLIVVAGGLGYGIYYASQAFPIITGYGAKNLCSCAYLSGRSEQSVLDNELSAFPLSIGTFELHPEDSSATASVFGFATHKAVFRKGLGCTLVNEMSEEELRKQTFNLPVALPNQDSIAWPMGNLVRDTVITGVDYTLLNKTVEEAFAEPGETKNRRTRAIIVIYDGQIIAEKYAEGFDKNTRQLGWSMAKSVTNSLIGILVRDGKLSLNDAAPFEEWKNDKRSAITINNLMQMSSGLRWEENYSKPSDATNMLFKSKDAGLLASHSPYESEPGKVFEYSSGTSNMLAWIIRHSVGDSAYYAFASERLFKKTGMHSMILEPDAGGTFVGSSYAFATPRDWGRFGLLFLNDGMFNGERILPEGWSEYSSTPCEGAPIGEYGAQFWLNAGSKTDVVKRVYPDVPPDLYWADGYEGQNVFILPSKDLVVVKLSQSSGNYLDDNQFLANIIKALP
ncbi:MAG: serine hydrolase [Cyclobacteriaceae bacterium]|nr:serine hydrolase [Cyclobacteriaceae bacterium]